jgi:hypothetical protein
MMAPENNASQVRVSNWTLATGTRPEQRVPIAAPERADG